MSLKYLTNIDLNNNELQNSVIQNLATAPSSPKKGQIYFNTASNKAFVYNGTAWVPWEADTNTLTGVKGNAESSYRTGNVNLTPANIGAVPTTRKVNGHALSADVTVTAADVGLGNVTDGAEVNQNAFSNVKVGSTTVAADSKTDTLELVAGSNVTITPDATNDKVTIAATNTTYGAGTQAQLEAGTDTTNRVWQAKILHDYMASVAGSVDAMRFKGTIGTGGDVTELPTSGVKIGDTYRVITAGTYASQTCEVGDLIIAIATTPAWTVAQTNIDGAITSISGTAPISASGTGSSRTITISAATQSAAGSMSAADKKKLDGIATGAQVNPTFTAFTGKPTANQTPSFGGTFTISQIQQATGGQVSGTDRTVKIPDTEATPTQKGLMPAQAYSDLYSLAGNLTSMFIDGFTISPDDTIDNIAGIQRYAECTTAAGTAEKTVSVLQGYSLDQYCIVLVKFKNTNTAAVANLKLNVNSTGAKPIKYRGGNLPSAGTLAANRIYWFVYDGTNYELVGDLDTDTTYSNKAAASGGTDVSLVTTGEKYTWNQKTSNTGTVTSVGSGTGLTGGPITTSGSLSLATVHSTAPGAKGDTSNQTPGFGSTFKVTSETVDAYGRTTALAEHTVKIPNAAASTSAAGLMSAEDKTKLDGITAGASVKKYYEENPGLTPSGGVCTWTVTHNLGTNVVDVRINEVDGGAFVMAEVIASSLNAVTIKLISNANIPASTYEAVVMG